MRGSDDISAAPAPQVRPNARPLSRNRDERQPRQRSPPMQGSNDFYEDLWDFDDGPGAATAQQQDSGSTHAGPSTANPLDQSSVNVNRYQPGQ